MSERFVLFDFDGVIADSDRIAIECEQIICPSSTIEDHRVKFEGNVNDYDLERPGRVHTAACRHDQDWWEIYLLLFAGVHPFAGSIRAVQDIADKYPLAIISSTISSPIDEFLTRYDARHYFKEIYGNDVHMSKVEKMQKLFAKYDLHPDDCVFITDTLGDMREAENVGVGVIAVSWGFHEHERLAKGRPYKIVDHPQDLPTAVDEYFLQPKSPGNSSKL